jgi:hypothetical protein
MQDSACRTATVVPAIHEAISLQCGEVSDQLVLQPLIAQVEMSNLFLFLISTEFIKAWQ